MHGAKVPIHYLDRTQVDVDVIKLLQQEEARCHALPSRNGIAFTCRGTNLAARKQT